MANIDWNSKFTNIVEQNEQSLYNICKACILYMEKCGEAAEEGFRFFLENIFIPDYDPDNVPEGFFNISSDNLDPDTRDQVRKLESKLVKELILKDVPEEEFYSEIWKRMCDPLLISDNDQKAYFLLRMWLDMRVPYFQLGKGMQMDEDVYSMHARQLELPYKKIWFAMHADYPQRTQRASVLIKIVEELPNVEDRVVLCSIVLGYLERKISDQEETIQELKQQLHDLQGWIDADGDEDE